MKPYTRVFACLLALVCLAGCASTKVSDRQIYVMENLPRPDHVFVHDFAATPADVPPGFEMTGQYAYNREAQTPDEIATGRELGARVAAKLAERIRDMGLEAKNA